MKVLYDHQIFSSQVYGGISRYFCELLSQYAGQPDMETEVALLFSNNVYLRNLGAGSPRSFFPGRKFTGKTTALNFLNTLRSRRSLSRGDFDVFHPTYYDPYFLREIGDKPYVVTVHDMVHELYPEMFPPDDPTRQWKGSVLERAAQVIAISERTREDLLRFHAVSPEKVTVIHHACSLAAASAPEQSFPERYLLFIGQRTGYKNFEFMVKALAALFERDERLSLFCVGGGPFSGAESALLSRLGMAGRVRQLAVDDEALALLYRQAEAFLYPSLYEGFGIPILEAFACGCPVVASNASCFPEVAADAAVYFDPHDQVSLQKALEKVLEDGGVRRELREKGAQRLKAFSWEKAAQETRKVYESLL